MNRFILALVVSSLISVAPANLASQPARVSYQGQLIVDEVLFTGDAQFKFAIVSLGQTIWSNDGTGVAGSEPATAVTLPVSNGSFSVSLGDSDLGMIEIVADLLDSVVDPVLRIWVNAGTAFEQLSDQKLSSNLFALKADAASRSLGDFTVEGELRVAPDGIRFPDDTIQTTATIGLSLPFSATATHSEPIPAFKITNPGDSDATHFVLDRSDPQNFNTKSAIKATGIGYAQAGFFQSWTTYANQPTVRIESGDFFLAKPGDIFEEGGSDALWATALGVNGAAARFIVALSENDAGAVIIDNDGSGVGLRISQDNETSDNEGLLVTSKSSSPAATFIYEGTSNQPALSCEGRELDPDPDSDRGRAAAFFGDVNVSRGNLAVAGDLAATGTMRTGVLEITGGMDVAEPFPVVEQEIPVVPGSVVVIDDRNLGYLCLSTIPYDSKVAGVVSGAGGIRPGLTLRQDGIGANTEPVALSGRVYARASAMNGAIRPGDLLTTSSIPGHAMRATDQDRSFGAVIGKAMSSLPDGEGLVLVLINLQ